MTTEMLAAWLRLSMTPGLGPISCQRLLSHFSCPLAIERSSPQQLAAWVPQNIREGLFFARGTETTQRIQHALKWALAPDQFILTQDQNQYPALLQQIADAPIVLYAKGNLSRLTHPVLAIVGARNATMDGLDHATDFALFLARHGWCIVSGLAQGADAAAHRGALKAGLTGGGTIAVLGTGIDIVYPQQHTELARRILHADGLLLTEFPPGTPARPQHFPRRNRIVAGLSYGVLVVEAELKSGSLLTAKLAVDMNREVFAIPGSIVSPLSRGPHALIQEGAKLVEHAQDILDELSAFNGPNGFASEQSTPAASPAAFQTERTPIPLATTEPTSPVLNAIGYDPITEGTLQQRTRLSPALLQCALLTLELNGDIERRPNGHIVRARRRL